MVAAITNTGDPLHQGTLTTTNVQEVVFDASSDPTPLSDGTIAVSAGSTAVLLGRDTGATNSVIGANATLEVATPEAAPGTVTFGAPTGTLQLDQFATFTETIAGFSGQDAVDLPGLLFSPGNTTAGYSGTSTGGTLTVSNGSQNASLLFNGNYLASTFVAANDGHGGTLITDPPASQTLLAQHT